jgi:hypothetical protein
LQLTGDRRRTAAERQGHNESTEPLLLCAGHRDSALGRSKQCCVFWSICTPYAGGCCASDLTPPDHLGELFASVPDFAFRRSTVKLATYVGSARMQKK